MQPMDQVVRAGPLEIRPPERTALADGRVLELTVRELQLLEALASRPDRIVSRAELYASVWDGELRSCDRSVDVYVSKLRAKLERALPRCAASIRTSASGTGSRPSLYIFFTGRSQMDNRLASRR
jgi:DNA-binding response OmpR family regulator